MNDRKPIRVRQVVAWFVVAALLWFAIISYLT
jgi:hypothetical protein